MTESLFQAGVFLHGRRRRTRKLGFQRLFSAVLFLLPLLFADTAYGDINIELAKAIDAGNTAKVEQLLKQGADINGKNEGGTSALMMYALMGRTETVKAVIEVGADINMKNNYGFAALSLAASKGHTETVKALIDVGADINAKTNNGQTVLMSAVFEGHIATVKALIDAGVDVNAGVEDDTAMKTAVLLGHTKIVEILKRAGAAPAIALEADLKKLSDYEALYDVVNAGEYDEIQVFVVVRDLRLSKNIGADALITKKVEEIGCTSLEIVEFFRDQGGLSKDLFDELAGLNSLYEKHQSGAYEKILRAEGATIGRLIRCVDEDILVQNIVDDFYLREKKWYDFLIDNS